MTRLRKISALVLAVMMIAVVGLAYATEFTGNVDGLLTDGKDGKLYNATDEGALDLNTLTFPKQIVLYNTTTAEVHHPVITYSYSIAPVATTNKTITDGDSDIGVVYPGETGSAAITSTISFVNTDSETAVTKNGKIASHDITVTITPSTFTHAGIYRYLITERNETADTDARTAAGISRGTSYINTRYLDVYVRRAAASDNASTLFVVYGYVLYKGTDVSITNAETEVTKSQGFVATETSTGVYGTTDVDYYETYNLKVIKNIEGTLAETAHEFPFSVAFTSPVTTNAVIEWAKGTATTAEATITSSALTLGDATTTGNASSAIKLADNEYVTFYGIPASTTAVVTEINDSWDVYTASQESITGGTSTPDAQKNIAAQSVTTSIFSIAAVANATTVTSNSEVDTELQVKNEIAVISPTGYVSRFAPYALILVAGIVLLIVAKKRKPAKDDEE